MRRMYVIIGSVVILVIASDYAMEAISHREFVLPEVAALPAGTANSVYMANGIKIGEVSSQSAIIWTRLTRDPATDANTKWGRVVTGMRGEVRILYWPGEDKSLQRETPWIAVDADRDFTRQLHLAELAPATDYSVLVEGRPFENLENVSRLDGKFKTAPSKEDSTRVHFSVITGQRFNKRDDDENGHTIYQSMRSMDLSFHVHTGDNVYYDQPKPYATTLALARFKWNRMYAFPFQRSFYNNVASYFMKDDHDTLKDDSYPGQTYENLTWDQGLEIFREQVPMGEKTYRTFRWGKHLQIWLMEGRDFRSANDMPDGPDKTIWGNRQKDWFFETVQNSDATFRILISPTPIVGPDQDDKADNHSNAAFYTEGEEIRSFVGSQKNMFIINGDRHWQYVSQDPVSGAIEFSSGPTTDEHAQGFKLRYRTPMHRYLKIKGGFLTVAVSDHENGAEITFVHHAVDGSIYNTETFKQ